jgi:hypothetical protein
MRTTDRLRTIPQRPLAVRICGMLLAASVLGACTHEGFGTQALHYQTFSVPEPKGSTVHVCHAYGCQLRTKFTFTETDLKELRSVMTRTRGKAADTPDEERRGIAYAIGWMETRVGAVIGTKDDRPGMDFVASGDPTQQDCVDEATNTTSYLNVLASAGLLRHHTVSTPFAKENYLRGVAGWTHWTAVIVEKPFAGLAAVGTKSSKVSLPVTLASTAGDKTPNASGQRWAVDSWIYANGENPAVVKAEDWYISDLDSLPPPRK